MSEEHLEDTIADITGNHKQPVVDIIKYTGLALFFAGLAVFIVSLGLSNYKLDEQVLKNAVGNETHYEVIRAEAQGMIGKTYSSKFTFLDKFGAVIAQANQSLDEGNKIYEYDQGVYKLNAIKAASNGPLAANPLLFMWLSIGLACFGGLMYHIPKVKEGMPGIKNDGIFFSHFTKGKLVGLLIGIAIITFYIFLYFYPQYISEWILMVDPISKAISGNPASRWFLYGYMYTLAILIMGVRMFIKYRHSTYQMLRTGSVMFFQTSFAFLIPEILVALNQPYYDFKNIWPLDYDFFFDWQLNTFTSSGSLGIFMLGWGIALIVFGVPLFTYFFGKRWYCSWVCGCGGLAETLGDPYRQLSDKSLKAWKIERWIVHGVLVFAVVMTGGVLYTYFTGDSTILWTSSYKVREIYGFAIGSIFAGVIGTGFYPFMGNRVWCRFGCPLAAYLGLVQRFKSRFRITTNGGQCISCGNCSTYCEMGIDVRWYAQRGQNIVRSSCVGCGVCSAVCPRGVLRLETGPEEERFNEPKAFTVTDKGVTVNV